VQRLLDPGPPHREATLAWSHGEGTGCTLPLHLPQQAVSSSCILVIDGVCKEAMEAEPGLAEAGSL
jgi:hypothetical protein